MLAQFEHWLERNLKGFPTRDENKQIRPAIAYFTIAWSLFEYRALGDGRGYERIQNFVQRHVPRDADHRNLDGVFDYFRGRYVTGGRLNGLYEGLTVRCNRNGKDLIESALLEEDVSIHGKLTGYLLVVYCLRNNFFHGDKWEMGLGDQNDNFVNAIHLLMELMDVYCPDPDPIV